MALHPKSCYCEACQEIGEAQPVFATMGYPAFCEDGSFPDPGSDALMPSDKPPGFGSEYEYDPSTFGCCLGRKGKGPKGSLGQAFVPGTVPPSLPPSAMSSAQAGVIAPVPGMNNAAVVTSPTNPSGMAPTLSYASAQDIAAQAGFDVNADGSISTPAGTLPPTIPTSYALAALALLLLLK